MIRRLFLSLGVAAVIAAAPAVSDAATRPLVLGGGREPGFSSTVALRTADGELVCSGVVIAPRAVLTAAHCVPPAEDRDTFAIRDACDGAGTDACAHATPVAGYVAHPDYDPHTFHADLAVLFLAADAPVTPAKLGPAARADDVVRIVGFGRSDPADRASVGVKLSVAVPIERVEDARIVYGVATCNGDSGGPAFAAEGVASTVVAITSSGPPGCVDFGKSTMVAPFRGWIDAQIAPEQPAGCAVSASARADREAGSSSWAIAFAIAALALRRRRARRRDHSPIGRPSVSSI